MIKMRQSLTRKGGISLKSLLIMLILVVCITSSSILVEFPEQEEQQLEQLEQFEEHSQQEHNKLSLTLPTASLSSEEKCMIPNCLTCSTNLPFTCQQCQQNKTCCSPNCLTCLSTDPTVCKLCASGYQYNITTKSCYLIEECNQRQCIQCSEDKKTCFACNFYYVLNTYTRECTLCPGHCQECTETLECVSCEVHSFKVNKTCIVCDESCQSCYQTATNCTSCQVSKYLDRQSHLCKSCIPNCVSCTNERDCFQCSVGYFYNEKTLICESCGQYCMKCRSFLECETCIQGYYLNETNKFCYTCDELIEHCHLCKNVSEIIELEHEEEEELSLSESSLKLVSIKTSSTLTTTKVTCLKCHEGYFLTNTTTITICEPCMENCMRCTNITVCEECQIGYFFNPEKNTCDLCNITACIVCETSKICTVCKTAYYWNNITHGNFPSCDRCRAGCSSCGVNYCTACEKGFYLTNQTCMKCSDECAECKITAKNCESCSHGYFALPYTYNCLRCRSECLRCLNYDACAECVSGYRLDSNTYKCIPCSIKNCSYCVIDNSDTNKKEYCLECMPFTYLVGNTSCQACEENCKYCTPTYCQSCVSRYYLNLNSSKCEKCPEHCLNCDIDQAFNKTVCQNCEQEYYLNEEKTKCEPCEVENCHSCELDRSCFSCKQGYYIDMERHPFVCQRCEENCTSCSSKEECTECLIGFYLSSDYKCQPCANGCKYCESDKQCYLCESGYRFNSTTSSCEECVIENCADCNVDTGHCTKCMAGYEMDVVEEEATTANNKNDLSLSLSSSESKNPESSNPITLPTLTTIICFKCGEEQLIGCQECHSSNKCTSCINGYVLNSNNQLCELETTTLWPLVLAVSVLSVIVLIFIGNFLLIFLVVIKIKKVFAGKKIFETLRKKKSKVVSDPENYQRLEELTIN